jgi:hypothetical protein
MQAVNKTRTEAFDTFEESIERPPGVAPDDE